MDYYIAVCDDERELSEKIACAMAEEFERKNYNMRYDYCSTGQELLGSVNDKEYKAILLDINMEQMDGFKVAQTLREMGCKAHIIFITSYDEVVYDSFDYMPFYFIRKSQYEKYCKRVVEKLLNTLGMEFSTVIEYNGKTFAIDGRDIIYINSDDHYLSIHTTNGDYLIREKISDFQQKCEKYGFARTHKKYIVNYRYVQKMDMATEEIILKNGERIRVGRTYKESFKEGLMRYHRTE